MFDFYFVIVKNVHLKHDASPLLKVFWNSQHIIACVRGFDCWVSQNRSDSFQLNKKGSHLQSVYVHETTVSNTSKKALTKLSPSQDSEFLDDTLYS